ncbi:MAG TPA: FAD-dependent oxidoreductase [Anaerolineales bacterium]|nr:FAD-dependent oxidoreductase [Anaerolineales bacterium]
MAATDLAVIGAGPAGLSAAVTAARAGAQVTVVDECPEPGGQYLRGSPRQSVSRYVSQSARRAQTLLEEMRFLHVDFRAETLAWALEGTGLALAGPSGSEWLEARAVVIAVGGREVVLPFPGWTLPGVMTLGGAQILAKAHGVLPGKRILLAGSGPLLLAAADELSRHGAQVLAVLEATHPLAWLRHGMAAWGNWDRLREGWAYLISLKKRGIPYQFGRTVSGVSGREQVEAATVVRLNQQGIPLPASEERLAADAVCVGFGFIPNIELTQLAGCEHEYDPLKGGWVPAVDETMETSIPGLFAAGETAGICGAEAAMLEGRVAGLAAALRLGLVRSGSVDRTLADLKRARRRAQRFGAMLNTLFQAGPCLDALTTDDTILCRCEDVAAGQLRAAVRGGIHSLDALKIATRAGQGACQGRTCGLLIARLIAEQTGSSLSTVKGFHVRPPLKPVPLGVLAQERHP